jgi:hypothetical protein
MGNFVLVSSMEGERKREEVPRRDAIVGGDESVREGGRDKGSYKGNEWTSGGTPRRIGLWKGLKFGNEDRKWGQG